MISDNRGTPVPFAPAIPWSPLTTRPSLSWPNQQSLAVCVVVHVEHVEWVAPDLDAVPPSVVRRPPYPALLDPHEVSPHEYGNRVGFFRICDMLDALCLEAAVAIDAASALRYRPIVEKARRNGWEFIAHGISGSRLLAGAVPPDKECAMIRKTLASIEQRCGVRPNGWAGVEYSESPRTLDILAEEGLSYVMDWANDEQPYRAKTASGNITVLPIALELDDVYSIHMRRITTSGWAAMVKEAVNCLSQGDPARARLLVLNLHAWIAGQPFRIGHVREALSPLVDNPNVWVTSPGKVCAHYLGTRPENE